MRWLFATIVLINLIVYYWFRGQSVPANDGSATSQIGSDIASLRFFSEVQPKHILVIMERPFELTTPEFGAMDGAVD